MLKTVLKYANWLALVFASVVTIISLLDNDQESLGELLLFMIIVFLMIYLPALLLGALGGVVITMLTKKTKSFKGTRGKHKHTDKAVPYLSKAQVTSLRRTAREAIQITAQNSSNLDLLQSKFGGQPYWPKGKQYPRSHRGTYLQLLAQINLSELPSTSLLPASGMLQFFIVPKEDDCLWGLSFAKRKRANVGSKLAQVVFWEKIIEDTEKLEQDFSFLSPRDDFPVLGEFSLTFTKAENHISLADYRIGSYLSSELLEWIDYDSSLLDNQYKLSTANIGHKIGGYPHFTQTDPRASLTYRPEEEPYELLFQMDSQVHKQSKGNRIQWGDAGVANFFIKPSDLAKKDFSNVLYNWDCY